MKNVKNTIPVYDICSLERTDHLNGQIIAELFAAYLSAHPNLHRPHRHSFYHIVLFTQGAGFHTIDFERFDVVTGQIYFMIPGQVHSWNFEGIVDGYVINFSEQLFENFLLNGQYLQAFPFFQGIAGDSVLNLDADTYSSARTIVAGIVADVQAKPAQMQDMLRALLIQLFIVVNRDIAKEATEANKPHNQLLLHNFRRLVDANYHEKRLPKEYAAMLYITPNHLNALCNDLIGKPAGEVIRDRILLEAKRLLVNAELSILDIAATLNFTDNSHFTRFFKKHVNATPEEFRRNSLAHH